MEKVKQAIKVFVKYFQENEPGTKMYLAWQEKNDPTRFDHLFIFENEAALVRHGQSAAVKQFVSVYLPQLNGRRRGVHRLRNDFGQANRRAVAGRVGAGRVGAFASVPDERHEGDRQEGRKGQEAFVEVRFERSDALQGSGFAEAGL